MPNDSKQKKKTTTTTTKQREKGEKQVKASKVG